MDHYEQKKSIN